MPKRNIAVENSRKIKRNEITERVSYINKKYPGTDVEAFAEAQKNIGRYMFEEGESVRVLNVDIENEN